MSNPFTTAPPSYAPPDPSKNNKSSYGAADSADSQPLLSPNAQASGSQGFNNAIYNQADGEDGIPDDFKYGTSVYDSAPEIKHAFVKKVYSILFVQILGTCIVAGALSNSPSTVGWVRQNQWAFFLPLIGTLVNLGFLYWKRHSHPLNFILLTSFTLLESFAIGISISFYDQTIVLQALLITLGVFLGLTLFTMQSKYDFSGMGPFLFAGLLVMMMSGFVSIIFPFSRTIDLVYAVGGCLLFSGYIVYDTSLIMKKLSPDEYIMGAISLYLDFINLFLSILRVLNNVNRD